MFTIAKTWNIHAPIFDYVEDFIDYDIPWLGHIFFAYDLVRNFKPETLVELGTFKGTSMYSFTQACKDANLDTILYAVDCWEGDENTGFYGDDIYQLVTGIVRKFYREQNVRLMKMYFDEALAHFADSSIDILHIDGLHTYEGAKHDYDTWKGKVKPTGAILFHDTQIADYGVWKVWEEAKAENPDAVIIEFKHSSGLGVILRDTEKFGDLKPHIDTLVEYYRGQAKAYKRLLTMTGQQFERARKFKKDIEDLVAHKKSLEKQLDLVQNTRLHHLSKVLRGN